jgi:hypothetical protein
MPHRAWFVILVLGPMLGLFSGAPVLAGARTALPVTNGESEDVAALVKVGEPAALARPSASIRRTVRAPGGAGAAVAAGHEHDSVGAQCPGRTPSQPEQIPLRC